MNKNLDNDFNIVISSKSEIKEFDFASYELNDVEIATVSEQEKIFMNTYKKMKNNLFEMCSSLALIEKTLNLPIHLWLGMSLRDLQKTLFQFT